MENKITPKEALINIAIAIAENFVSKDEPKRTEQINSFLNTKECRIINQALTELEETKVLCESFQKDANRLNEQGINLHLKDKKQTQILEVLKSKKVDIFLVGITDCVEEYNDFLGGNRKKYPLTETEFDLIKEWLK